MDSARTERQPATILVIDDHPLVRDALCANLQKAGFDPARLRTATTLSAGLPLIADIAPDLILLDLELGDASGLEGLSRVQGVDGDIPVMIVSSHDDAALMVRARALGARGFITKSEPGEAISAAVLSVLNGGEAFPEGLSAHGPDDGAADSPAARVTTLTPAQRRVSGFLSEGLLNKQIAYEMGISEATVKAHMTAIFRKLGVTNRTQALRVLTDALRA